MRMGDDPADFDVSAALLRRGHDTTTLVSELAERLARALPDRVTVRRTGLLKGRTVRSVIVDLGAACFRVEVEGHRAAAWVDDIVRGVRIKSVELGVDEWLDRLAVALSAEANRSVEVRLALRDALL
jgi:hypothetical protein